MRNCYMVIEEYFLTTDEKISFNRAWNVDLKHPTPQSNLEVFGKQTIQHKSPLVNLEDLGK